jgi:hypothetical protein
VSLVSIWRLDTTDNSPRNTANSQISSPYEYCWLLLRTQEVIHLVLHRNRQLNVHRLVGQKQRFLHNSTENADQLQSEETLSVHAVPYRLQASYTVAQFLCHLTTSAAQIIQSWRHMNEYGTLVE